MGNIVGLNMDSWAVDQIRLRQTLLGTKQLPQGDSASVLTWMTNNTSWIRACSPISVSTEKSKKLTGEEFKYAGRELAKQYVLFNGTVGLQENQPGDTSLGFTPITKAGVTNNNSVINNFAYGFGGIDQGIVPMPGINGLRITTLGRGSIRKAELKVKAFNKNQFDIIDSLYMRPGFTILLEWGHTLYFKGTVERPQYTKAEFNTKPFKSFFTASGTTQDQILNDIREERGRTGGNYDGFYGKVTNFSWTYNTDGTYDITISAISIGDVIESLNINRVELSSVKPPDIPVVKTSKTNVSTTPTNPGSVPQNQAGQYPIILKTPNGTPVYFPAGSPDLQSYVDFFKQASKLDENAAYQAALAYVTNNNINGKVPRRLRDITITTPSEEPITGDLIADKNRSDFNKFIYNIYNNLQANLKKNAKKVKSSINLTNTISTFSSFQPENNWVWGGENQIVGIQTTVQQQQTNEFGETAGTVTRISKNYPYLYIKLGSLLQYIQNNLLVYNTKDETGKGIPYINFELDENNYCFTFPFQFSSNPGVCVIPFNTAKADSTITNEIENTYWTEILGTSFNTDSPYVGNLYQIHVNINHVASLLKSCSSNNSLPLLKFLETLMKDIQVALGSINSFTVSYDHDTNRIKIYDDIPLNEEFVKSKNFNLGKNETANFNVVSSKSLGNGLFEGSFIRNINLTTTISNNLATMISVGAQARTKSDVVNATGFMNFNDGLEDSIIPNKISAISNEANQNNLSKVAKDIVNGYIGLKKPGGIIQAFYNQAKTISSEMTNSNQTVASSVFRYYISEYSLTGQTPTQPFIPFNLGLEMDGFSGPKIYEKFTITTEILPPGYPETLNFVIKGLSHNIDGNGWTTSIESLTLAR
jgi:hypothetical protein